MCVGGMVTHAYDLSFKRESDFQPPIKENVIVYLMKIKKRSNHKEGK